MLFIPSQEKLYVIFLVKIEVVKYAFLKLELQMALFMRLHDAVYTLA